jgi:hypothetical protein
MHMVRQKDAAVLISAVQGCKDAQLGGLQFHLFFLGVKLGFSF